MSEPCPAVRWKRPVSSKFGRLDPPVAVALGDLGERADDLLPERLVGRQDVVRPARRLELRGSLRAARSSREERVRLELAAERRRRRRGPGRRRRRGRSGRARRRTESSSVSQSPPGRSTRPTEPSKRRSPEKTAPSTKKRDVARRVARDRRRPRSSSPATRRRRRPRRGARARDGRRLPPPRVMPLRSASASPAGAQTSAPVRRSEVGDARDVVDVGVGDEDPASRLHLERARRAAAGVAAGVHDDRRRGSSLEARPDEVAVRPVLLAQYQAIDGNRHGEPSLRAHSVGRAVSCLAGAGGVPRGLLSSAKRPVHHRVRPVC